MCYDYDSNSFISIPFVLLYPNTVYILDIMYIYANILVSYVGNSFGFAPLYSNINAHLKLIIVFAQVLYILTFPSIYLQYVKRRYTEGCEHGDIVTVTSIQYRCDIVQIYCKLVLAYHFIQVLFLKFNSIHVNLVVSFYPKINFRVLFIWILHTYIYTYRWEGT